MRDTNSVTLIGRPTGIIEAEFTTPDNKEFIVTQLSIKRMSGTDDLVYITLPVEQKDLLKEEKLLVRGVYRTYNVDTHVLQRVFVKEAHSLPAHYQDVNQFVFTGTIVGIKSLRTSPAGRIVIDLTVAVNSGKKTAYVPCIAWGTLARYLCDTPVGTRLTGTARLQSRHYTKMVDDTPVDKIAYEVSIMDVEVLDGK